MRRMVSQLYPPRAALLSLILVPLVALSVGYPVLLTKWYLPGTPVNDAIGALLVGFFGGFALSDEIPIVALAQYLMMFLPPIILTGYGYSRQGKSWQWMTALRRGSFSAWWRTQLAGVWLGAISYRVIQMVLVVAFGVWQYHFDLQPLGGYGLAWMMILLTAHTALWMHLQLLLQLVFDDARIGFGVPLMLLIFSLLLGVIPTHLSAKVLPGLWGMAWRSWLLDGQGFGPWALLGEGIMIAMMSLGGWWYLKRVGLRSR